MKRYRASLRSQHSNESSSPIYFTTRHRAQHGRRRLVSSGALVLFPHAVPSRVQLPGNLNHVVAKSLAISLARSELARTYLRHLLHHLEIRLLSDLGRGSGDFRTARIRSGRFSHPVSNGRDANRVSDCDRSSITKHARAL